MIKKLILFFVVAVMAVSCLGEGGYTESRSVMATFEFSADYTEIFGSDSLYVDVDHRIGIGWDYLVFYQKVDKSTDEFEGGLMLSHLAYPKSGTVEGLANNKYRANDPVAQELYESYVESYIDIKSDITLKMLLDGKIEENFEKAKVINNMDIYLATKLQK